MLAARAGAATEAILWVSTDAELRRHGAPYGPGLAELGLAPDRMMLVTAPDELAGLRVASDSVACSGLAAAVIEAGSAKRLDLTASRRLEARHAFVRGANGAAEAEIDAALGRFAGAGVRVVVASEAFGVDETEREERIAERARAAGMRATTGHEVSSLYGLRVRTRTAVINAAILPKMIETAEMTDACVRSSGIRAPLMIMRSDGGVMSVAEVHKRPILTMLSGPAAGIAGALMHERVSDGIFIEVGGTSADISVIRDGSPAIRPARLNGHRMYLNTLDVRTLGVGGGSLVRVSPENGAVRDVGPRSAHIAGLGYACFAAPEEMAAAEVELIEPTPGDAADHLILISAAGKRYAITTTCAANLLGLVQPHHFAYGDPAATAAAFARVAARFGGGLRPERIAEEILEVGCRKLAATIDELIAEYHLSRDQIVLVGGGGGAASLVPFTGRLMSLDHRIARNAEVISPIGVAMAMVRDTVERNIVDPTPDEILKIRREAAEAAIAAGAVAESVEVQVEVDKRRNLVRATAMGTTELRKQDEPRRTLSADDCREAAARSMRLAPDAVTLAAETAGHLVFTGRAETRSLFGLFASHRAMLRVVDRTGVVRLQRGAAVISDATLARLPDELTRVVEQLTDYGDAGRTIPDLFLLYGARIANFSGLADLDQVLALADVELRSLDPAMHIVILACPKQL